MYNYGYNYGYSTRSSGLEIESLALLLIIVAVGAGIMALVAWGKILEKSDHCWATMLVPGYGAYLSYDVAGCGPVFWFVLILGVLAGFLPIIMPLYAVFAAAAYCLQCIMLARTFGKSIGFGIGLIFLSPVFLMILGFGDAERVDSDIIRRAESLTGWVCSCGEVVPASHITCDSCGAGKPRDYKPVPINSRLLASGLSLAKYWDCPCGISNPMSAMYCSSCGHNRVLPKADPGRRPSASRTAARPAQPEASYTAVTKWSCACGRANSMGFSACPGCGAPRPEGSLVNMTLSKPQSK